MPLYEAYLQKSALDHAQRHALELSKRGVECMGLLVGEAFLHKGKPYTLIEDYVTATNDSTAISVRFSPEAFADLAKQYSSKHKGKLVVGWCHSHPGYGCFLSGTDLSTQRRYFSEPWHVAVVIDPLRSENGSPARKVFKLNSASYEEVSYAVIERRD